MTLPKRPDLEAIDRGNLHGVTPYTTQLAVRYALWLEGELQRTQDALIKAQGQLAAAQEAGDQLAEKAERVIDGGPWHHSDFHEVVPKHRDGFSIGRHEGCPNCELEAALTRWEELPR